MVFPKSFANNLMATKADYQIINMRSKEAGQINVEILPCNNRGEIINDPGLLPVINDPKTDLLNKTLNFMIRIIEVKGLEDRYEVKSFE
jgi:hypothetical protein